MAASNNKIVADAIFGFITLKPHILAIIDTPEFQRLRWIWQLGLTAFVYPTADHTRFEHSIGTYWLASKLVSKLQEQLNEENAEISISDKDVKCVEIAALCHDIGHGPFSHTWEKVLKRQNPSHPSHEDQFNDIWVILKQNNKIAEMIQRCELDSDDELLINDLISGKEHRGKEVLSHIVSNHASGMDVDKWDYLARDTTYLGHASTNFRADIERMIHFARAMKNSDGRWEIAFRKSESINLIRVFQLRHHLYQTGYLHNKVMIIEQMFLDGIKRGIDGGCIREEEIGTAKWIIRNSDGILLANSDIDEFKRILNRDLYKPILVAIQNKKIKDPSNDIRRSLKDEGLDTSNIRFIFNQFKLGNKDSNPIYDIPFYVGKTDYRPYKYSTDKPLPSKFNINCDESKVIVVSTIPGVGGAAELFGELKLKLRGYFDEWEIEDFQ